MSMSCGLEGVEGPAPLIGELARLEVEAKVVIELVIRFQIHRERPQIL